ncbi:unnamed protein product [Acanthoscelides obtectus]|uniref:Uncharacterized protein n=1 Tax=Acanthoscelides obtectus TaxID=200917 RepID=A0A9P0PWG3_ACAOB|nr:unnamed protein product [Acanthoscelides obtectus]CAK1649677.1 hypothetical protein AOBTE_LOCUS16354 [Acanthoscelides obtectus]
MALPRQNFKKKSSNIRIDSSFSASDEVRLSLNQGPKLLPRVPTSRYEGTCSLTSPAEARKAIARKLGQLKSFPTAITQFADLSNCTTALPSNHSTCQP